MLPQGYSSQQTTRIHVGKTCGELYGPLGVLHKDTVGSRLVSHLQTVERGCGRNLWKCQLFSYLRCMYSLKMWQMYCRTGIKMSRWNRVFDLSNIYYNSSQIWHLLPPTGCFVYHVREYYEHMQTYSICTKILNQLYYELNKCSWQIFSLFVWQECTMLCSLHNVGQYSCDEGSKDSHKPLEEFYRQQCHFRVVFCSGLVKLLRSSCPGKLVCWYQFWFIW